jgi:hypothetical protein
MRLSLIRKYQGIQYGFGRGLVVDSGCPLILRWQTEQKMGSTSTNKVGGLHGGSAGLRVFRMQCPKAGDVSDA